MKILVFGKTGQVATELQRLANVTALGRDEADLSDPQACARIIAQTDANVIINAAAYTAVDGAETDAELAKTINAIAPAAMARAAATRGLPFLHLSTDYVFDGSGDLPRITTAEVGPLNVYGSTKLAGEQGVTEAGGTHIILRTSWVFSAHGSNFVKTMLRLGKARDSLSIVNNQIGGPTAAADIANTVLTISKALNEGSEASGIYHYTGSPDVSWEDFAVEIFKQVGRSTTITGIPTFDYPTPAKRPLNSRLDCSKIQNTFGISRPDWRNSLNNVLSELGEIA